MNDCEYVSPPFRMGFFLLPTENSWKMIWIIARFGLSLQQYLYDEVIAYQ